MSSFYRFRSVDALLDKWNELSRLEIYFAPPEQLNDPMDGYRDLVWLGDEIVWRNLLRNYLLCLTQTVFIGLVAGKGYQPTLSRDLVFSTELSFPSERIKALFVRIRGEIFSTKLSELVPLLARRQRPMRRDALEYCLRVVHSVALNVILKVFREDGILPAVESSNAASKVSQISVLDKLHDVLATLISNDGELNAEAEAAIFTATNHIYREMGIRRYLDAEDGLARSWHSIFYSYPESYLDGLSNLTYIDWYAACFVADPTHAAMWGSYGDGHKGVCLKFGAQGAPDKAGSLTLRGVIGASAGPQGEGKPVNGPISLLFQPVRYKPTLPEIDFFRSIGRLTIPELKHSWYSDDAGNLSDCARDVLSKTDDWRARYWKGFHAMTTTKLTDWEQEREYRLILSSPLGSHRAPESRKLTYSFSSLEGIIFGIRTPLEVKARLVNLIKGKCKETGRRTFEFGQAAYSPVTGKIEIRPLNLLGADGQTELSVVLEAEWLLGVVG